MFYFCPLTLSYMRYMKFMKVSLQVKSYLLSVFLLNWARHFDYWSSNLPMERFSKNIAHSDITGWLLYGNTVNPILMALGSSLSCN